MPRTFFPSLAPSISSISDKKGGQGPFLLDFSTGWNENSPIRSWYEQECRAGSTAIEKLQFRKDRTGPWFHGYIILFTSSERIYRVDRRPDILDDEPDIMAFMRAGGCRALDTISVQSLQEYELSARDSDCLVELHFHHRNSASRTRPNQCHSIYLLHVLSACFGVRDDPSTRQYTLQRWVSLSLSPSILTSLQIQLLLLILGTDHHFYSKSGRLGDQIFAGSQLLSWL